MKLVVYIDVIFFINFMADLYVLLITKFILREKAGLLRIVPGAFLGAALLLPFLMNPYFLMGIKGALIYTGISMGTIAVAFGTGKSGFIKKWFLSTTITFLLGGIMYFLKELMGFNVISIFKWLFLFGAGCIASFMGIHLLKEKRQAENTIYCIEIIKGNRRVSENVYLDTGNMLWDALYQKPVILLSEREAKKCFYGDELLCFDKLLENKTFDYNLMLQKDAGEIHSFHKVRYQSVGEENGWLICFLADEVIIDGKRSLYRQPVAVAPAFLFDDKEYKGLMHEACI